MNFTDAEQYLEKIKKMVGSKWLAEKYSIITSFEKKKQKQTNKSKFHPFAYIIYNAERHIIAGKKNRSGLITEEILRLCKVGIDIEVLQKNNVDGLDGKLKELMSESFSQIEKTIFEISIASLLIRRNHSVKFLKTRDKLSLRTPDLLVDDSIEFECTKLDDMTKRDRINFDHWNFIQRKINYLNQEPTPAQQEPYCFTFIEYADDPHRTEIDETIRLVNKSIKRENFGTFELGKNRVTINKIFNNKTEESDSGLNFSDRKKMDVVKTINGIMNVLEQKNIDKETIEKIRSGTDYEFAEQRISIHDSKIYYGEIRCIFIKTKNPPDRVKRVLTRIHDKLQQFSKTKPSMICIDVSKVAPFMEHADYRRLGLEVDKILQNNSSLSAVAIVSEEIIRNTNSMNLRKGGIILKNKIAKHPISDNILNFIGLRIPDDA